ncbi:MAG: site-2 protease family protein [Limnohabitans sp.]|jgi:Zn-dependent protease|nr:site-2 protease family protein [Limnohabitans sp.]
MLDDIGIFGIYNSMGFVGAASFVFWAVASITLHELAHGWAAIWQGDDTPRVYGRMTPNPLVHMGVYSLVCLLLVGIAWGSMPTNPGNYRWGRRGRIVVSGAGPAMNVLLAFLCWTAVGLIAGLSDLDPEIDSPMRRAFQFAVIGGSLNGLLALFNMLPVPPFDGASVVAGFSRTYYRWMHDPRVQGIGLFIVLVAMFSGIAGLLGGAAEVAGMAWAGVVAGLAGLTQG